MRRTIYSRQPVPVGTIRERFDRRGRPMLRMVKVRMDGPKSRRWKDYARWWWEKNVGPVPEGKRVCHLDGDSMNDDPGNFGLLTAGDVIFLCHERDPRMSDRNRRQASQATAEANRVRGTCHRARHWLANYWYPVDFQKREILNKPRRKRWMVYHDAGVPMDEARDWRWLRSRALGWPRLNCMQACILAVLADEGPLARDELRANVERLRRENDWTPYELAPAVMHTCLSALGHRIVRLPDKRLTIAPSARSARLQPCPIVPRRGRDIAAEESMAGFTKVLIDDDAFDPKGRELSMQGAECRVQSEKAEAI